MEFTDVFPYPQFRGKQLELIKEVYSACVDGRRLIVEAFNGFGKTVSVLSGALCAAIEENFKIIYICRTKRQMTRVVQELQKIQNKVRVQACFLSTKSDYCTLIRDEGFSISEKLFSIYCNFKTSNNLCNYFVNFYRNYKESQSLVRNFQSHIPDYVELLKSGKDHNVCPYEMQKLIAINSTLIIMPYDYVFQTATIDSLLGNDQFSRKKTILIVDEAHNLPDHLLDKCVISIDVKEIERAIYYCNNYGLAYASENLAKIKNLMLQAARSQFRFRIDAAELRKRIKALFKEDQLQEVINQLSAPLWYTWLFLSSGVTPPECIYNTGFFLSTLLTKEGSTLYFSKGIFYLLDEESFSELTSRLSGYRTTIYISATLNPIDNFLRQINEIKIPKVFSVQNPEDFGVLTIIDKTVSTEFKKRNVENYRVIARKIAFLSTLSRGNTCVFTTSYQQQEFLEERLYEIIPNTRIYLETRKMDNVEAAELSSRFSKEKNSILIAVQGGKFSEGEDTSFGNISVVIVVGLALPPPTAKLFLKYNWFKERDLSPRMTGSLIPAVRKAIQASGRVLRSPNKKGVVALLDYRFLCREVLTLLPNWLKENIILCDLRDTKSFPIRDLYLFY